MNQETIAFRPVTLYSYLLKMEVSALWKTEENMINFSWRDYKHQIASSLPPGSSEGRLYDTGQIRVAQLNAAKSLSNLYSGNNPQSLQKELL